jgi:hypothetical protein
MLVTQDPTRTVSVKVNIGWKLRLKGSRVNAIIHSMLEEGVLQDRYAGDIGDYVKLALLRYLSRGRKLGVAWYLHPNEEHNADGQYIAYLQDPSRWRDLDPQLFDALCHLVERGRSVRAIQETGVIDGSFSGELLISAGMPWRSRENWRAGWFERVRSAVADAEIVFVDPDNGLVDDDPRRPRRKTFGKQLPLHEAKALADRRVAVIYHHNTRRKGGHDAEVSHWLARLGEGAIAIRVNAYSCRTFFIVNPDECTRDRAASFCERWQAHSVRLHR